LSGRRIALLLYFALLGASHVAWRLREHPPELDGDEELSQLPVPESEGSARSQVVYWDRPADSPAAPVLLFLHGSPGRKEHFGRLAGELAGRYRVVALDLPGFGKSDWSLPDTSIRTHARYTLELMDELGIGAAHVVGFSLGGGVGLEMWDLAPKRVASLVLLSSIGVQELELFGTYELNHGLHGLQLGLVQTLRWTFPHFGADDGLRSALAYAANFYDTDQRPLRGVLERFEPPLLILHGEEDFLVPAAAAREHHRIVPQSELVMYDGSHFLLWTRVPDVARRIADVVDATEAGRAVRRRDAPPERVARAARPFDPASVPRFAGPALLVILLLVALGTLVSEDLTCIAAGLLVSQGRLGFVAASGAAFMGIFLGDMLLYLAGRTVGRPIVERRPVRWLVSAASVARAARWFERRGPLVVVLSRFMPGLRLPTYVVAGIVRANAFTFCLYFVVAGLLWTPLLVGFSAWAGKEAADAIEGFDRFALPAFLGLLLVLFVVQRAVLPSLTHRGRRLLLGSFRRKIEWEYWPLWVLYAPVLVYAFWLMLRHRSLTVASAVNPGIPAGGFVGESKRQILDALDPPAEFRADYLLLAAETAPEEREREARVFAGQHGLPVVLKPDTGQRGAGVRILRDEGALRAAARDVATDSLLQEYVDGPEFGVFYVRHPDAERGRIFSITEKRLPSVVGDGERTLERLILDDPRAVCMARAYMEANAERLLDVVPPGESVRLVELGTHCRGAIFLDGRHVHTPELAEAFERISRRFEGFHFGRYDVRARSVADLQAGRFKVLELNGLTSEATHIYDPRISLREAWATLFEQWRLAFEIGAANRRRGARPASPGEILRALWSFRRAGSRARRARGSRHAPGQRAAQA